MPPIQPIQNLTQPNWSPKAAQHKAQSKGDAGFGDMFKQAINNVDGEQQQSTSAVADLISGRTDNVANVVTQVAQADMSFKLLMGVRNKMIQAYKTTINMQV
jgi:flagellar hook-basal body complex protein FliE